MRCRNPKHWLTVRRASHSVRSAKNQSIQENSSRELLPHEQKQSEHLYPSISTARIMQAVEQQRRISQQLEDLHTQQVQRTAILLTKSLKVSLGLIFALGTAGIVLVILSIFQPQILMPLKDGVVLLVAFTASFSISIGQIPLNNWVLSGVALAFVLMMALWLRLMRYPREM